MFIFLMARELFYLNGAKMKKLLKNKKGIVEVFMDIIPIFVFIIFCVVILVLFNFITYRFNAKIGKDDAVLLEQKISTRQMDLPALLSSQWKYKDEKGKVYDYNISMYEIFYYNIEDRYSAEILSYLDKFDYPQEIWLMTSLKSANGKISGKDFFPVLKTRMISIINSRIKAVASPIVMDDYMTYINNATINGRVIYLVNLQKDFWVMKYVPESSQVSEDKK